MALDSGGLYPTPDVVREFFVVLEVGFHVTLLVAKFNADLAMGQVNETDKGYSES
jgi:hypothetical protein